VDLRPTESGTQIYMAKDKSRDQSYFLWDVEQEALSRMITPLAGVIKKEIPTPWGEMICAGESRELCFAQGGYEEYLRERGVSCPPGDFVDRSGRVLGRHSGIHRYTVGQRKSLDIALGRRCYVLAILPQSNRVVLGFEEEAKCSAFTVDGARKEHSKDVLLLMADRWCRAKEVHRAIIRIPLRLLLIRVQRKITAVLTVITLYTAATIFLRLR
jgi:tRNA U34 2-thiouridine synthase MnmA/TrmU